MAMKKENQAAIKFLQDQIKSQNELVSKEARPCFHAPH